MIGSIDEVLRDGCLSSLPVGLETLGRIIDPLGNPLDDGPPIKGDQRLPLFQLAPEFIDRKSVDEPLLTGVMVIDAAIPIGRWQRACSTWLRMRGHRLPSDSANTAAMRSSFTTI